MQKHHHSVEPHQIAAASARRTVSLAESRSICVAIAVEVSRARGVAAFSLFTTNRQSPIADARHLAIYIAHVELGLPMREVADAFGRDRTTIAHACRKIEDGRDDTQQDRLIGHLTGRIAAMLAGAPSRAETPSRESASEARS